MRNILSEENCVPFRAGQNDMFSFSRRRIPRFFVNLKWSALLGAPACVPQVIADPKALRTFRVGEFSCIINAEHASSYAASAAHLMADADTGCRYNKRTATAKGPQYILI